MSGISYYTSLRESLKAQLIEDSENSIQNIIQSLAWNDSIYRTFNEGLRLATSKKRRDRIPKTLVEYIHIAHISHVVIALRKLYENKKRGSRAIDSIRTISRRIADNKHLITRENYLIHDNTPYDDRGSLDRRTRLVVQGRHRQFDKFCGLKVGFKRKPDDIIDPAVPNSLQKYAVLHPNIEQFANKFLAHASAHANRPDEKLTFENLKLHSIQNQYRNLIWSVQQIAKIVDEAVITQVPVATFDVLTDWEQGLFDRGIKSKLQSYWEKRTYWWQKWTDHYRDSTTLFLSPRKQT